uniref:Uncharacterized protein n=1 Tax=Anguilla anguilla TaxID=7936 RepID=A0A0E9WS21_ANGAN
MSYQHADVYLSPSHMGTCRRQSCVFPNSVSVETLSVVSVLNGICVLLYGAATYCYLTFFIFICTCDVSEYCNLLHLYI